MKVLITGGAGFVGSHAAKMLQERGDEVVLWDNFSDFLYPSWLKRARVTDFLKNEVPVIEGDITDAELLEKTFREGKFEVVLHLAAHANPKESVIRAQEYTYTNVNGTLAVLEAATKYDVKRLVFAGSSSVYNDEQTPFEETTYPLRPKSPYGASKAAAEDYCSMWHDLHGLPITVLRFFSVYGPWGRPDMAPMIFAEKILTEAEVPLNKDDRQRDVTHINDLVRAIGAAVDKDLGFEIINAGRGEPVPLRKLVDAIAEAAGKSPIIVPMESPAGEMRVTYADTTKAQKLLGWIPEISVQDGVRDLVEWMKNWYLPQKR